MLRQTRPKFAFYNTEVDLQDDVSPDVISERSTMICHAMNRVLARKPVDIKCLFRVVIMIVSFRTFFLYSRDENEETDLRQTVRSQPLRAHAAFQYEPRRFHKTVKTTSFVFDFFLYDGGAE